MSQSQMTQTSFLGPDEAGAVNWTPTRAAAKDRLTRFAPRAGRAYAGRRNFDLGTEHRGNISALSPWIRHRALLEEDVVQAALAKHGARGSEKFIQEVFWRGYFKGWLEHRPLIWQRYKQDLVQAIDQIEKDAGLAARYESAVGGRTGIACFDAWAKELIETGYLHNHARMWFASIWAFTLELPWELGADFFYRHLLDGDPASNTCSWRWVCGLHTEGKTYLAKAWNIEKFTEGRFNPEGQLAPDIRHIGAPDLPDPVLPNLQHTDFTGHRFGLLVTEEDTSPDRLALPHAPAAIMALTGPAQRSTLAMSPLLTAFAPALLAEAAPHIQSHFEQDCLQNSDEDWGQQLTDWAASQKLDCIVTSRLPIGPVRKRVHKAVSRLNIPLIEITRPYDQALWPYTKRGFFALKKKMPIILGDLGLG